MKTLYVLQPESVPAYAEIEAVIASQYKIVPVSTLEALTEFRNETGVLLLGGDLAQLPTRVSMARTLAPRFGTVMVLHQTDLSNLPSEQSYSADVLSVPFHTAEVSIRLDAAYQFSELKQLLESGSQHDEMTDLYNYSYFTKRLGDEIALARRHLSPVTCVILSMSFYDVYMDSYGYTFVADVMKQLAAQVLKHVRTEDIVARLNDNEIALLLSRTTEKGAVTLTQRIIQSIEKHPVYMGDQEEHLFLNAGIAGYLTPQEQTMDADTLIRFARHALHTARCSDETEIQLFSEMKIALD